MMNNLNDFFEYFAGGGFQITLTVLVVAVILVFLVLMMYVPVLTRKIFPKFGYAKYSNYLPFGTVFNDNSMQLTDGSLIRVYRVAGLQTSMQDDATKEKFLDLDTAFYAKKGNGYPKICFLCEYDAIKSKGGHITGHNLLTTIWGGMRRMKIQTMNLTSRRYNASMTSGVARG